MNQARAVLWQHNAYARPSFLEPKVSQNDTSPEVFVGDISLDGKYKTHAPYPKRKLKGTQP